MLYRNGVYKTKLRVILSKLSLSYTKVWLKSWLALRVLWMICKNVWYYTTPLLISHKWVLSVSRNSTPQFNPKSMLLNSNSIIQSNYLHNGLSTIFFQLCVIWERVNLVSHARESEIWNLHSPISYALFSVISNHEL